MNKDQEISDEVYRAMSGLKLCRRCKKEFKPISAEDDICCMSGVEVAGKAMAQAMSRVGISGAEAGKALRGVMVQIKLNKED